MANNWTLWYHPEYDMLGASQPQKPHEIFMIDNFDPDIYKSLYQYSCARRSKYSAEYDGWVLVSSWENFEYSKEDLAFSDTVC